MGACASNQQSTSPTNGIYSIEYSFYNNHSSDVEICIEPFTLDGYRHSVSHVHRGVLPVQCAARWEHIRIIECSENARRSGLQSFLATPANEADLGSLPVVVFRLKSEKRTASFKAEIKTLVNGRAVVRDVMLSIQPSPLTEVIVEREGVFDHCRTAKIIAWKFEIAEIIAWKFDVIENDMFFSKPQASAVTNSDVE